MGIKGRNHRPSHVLWELIPYSLQPSLGNVSERSPATTRVAQHRQRLWSTRCEDARRRSNSELCVVVLRQGPVPDFVMPRVWQGS